MGGLFSYGVWAFDFSLLWSQVVMTFATGFLTQLFWMRRLKLGSDGLLSAFITCLSLILLLRSQHLWVHPLAAFIAINSKFLIQYKGQHFFNPSAFGIFAVLLWGGAWLSPGQWGSGVSLAVWMVAIGHFIAGQVRRMDTAWPFLLFYLGGLGLRDLYLGYEMVVFYHGALKGSLLLFAFFMISDPKSSPNHFMGKVLFAFMVAIVSLFLHYYFYMEDGLIYALMLGSCFVPLFNHWFPAESFRWNRSKILESFS